MRRLSVASQVLVLVVCALSGSTAYAQTAQQNFNSICGACHSVGGGRRVGPDLAGVTTRRSRDWLVRFITNSQDMVNSGDAAAVALFNEYNRTTMPPAPYSRAQIEEIIDFLGNGSAAAAPAPEITVSTSPGMVARGQRLFQGSDRFTNGGAPCMSCHHVGGDSTFGGGLLAKELTDAFSRMGAGGIQGILRAPPFPVMASAYNGHALEADEIAALTSYFRDASGRANYAQPRENTVRLVGAGLAVFACLMGLYSYIWRRRKLGAVNHAVFARQLRSE